MQNHRVLLGSQLEQARKARRWNLTDVAHRIGRNFTQISRIERGKTNTTVDLLSEIGAALGLTLTFVPEGRLPEVLAIVGHQAKPPTAYTDLPTIYDEVFIPDDADPDDDITPRGRHDHRR